MWHYSLDELFGGILGAVLVMAVIVGICWIALKSGNKSAKKFKTQNPDTATIWIVQEHFWGVKIKKSDGSKPKSFQNGIADGSGGTYILPGEHVLTLEHIHANPEIYKSAEFKKNRITELKVLLEPGKDYTLLYNELPGGYTLVEGKA